MTFDDVHFGSEDTLADVAPTPEDAQGRPSFQVFVYGLPVLWLVVVILSEHVFPEMN